MLYLGSLILLTVLSFFLLRWILAFDLQIKESMRKVLELEHASLAQETAQLKNNNLSLELKVNETIDLYTITKDVCRSLEVEKIFAIFKERINNYLKVSSCQFLGKDSDLSLYKGYTILPLTIQKDMIGYLVASDINDKDKNRFLILGQQFLIGIKRAFLYKKMQELSITDSLTHLFSRRHFLGRFKEELLRSNNFKHNLSFLMVDIDKFKGFNDKYGHLVGDAILREVSKTIKETIRQIDFVGRYGGEELSVVLAETDKEQARFAAERLRQAIEAKEIKVYDEVLKVTISIGIATFPDDEKDVGMLIERADKALYQAKQTGRNKVCSY